MKKMTEESWKNQGDEGEKGLQDRISASWPGFVKIIVVVLLSSFCAIMSVWTLTGVGDVATNHETGEIKQFEDTEVYSEHSRIQKREIFILGDMKYEDNSIFLPNRHKPASKRRVKKVLGSQEYWKIQIKNDQADSEIVAS